MTTNVAKPTNVVNLFRLTPREGAASCEEMRAFHDRIAKAKSLWPDLTWEDFAAKAGMSRQGVTRWIAESKKHGGKLVGRAETVREAAKAWGVDPEWLLSGDGEPRPDSLDTLESVLGEQDWDDVAVAAAMQMRRRGARNSKAGWRDVLERVQAISQPKDGTDGQVIELNRDSSG